MRCSTGFLASKIVNLCAHILLLEDTRVGVLNGKQEMESSYIWIVHDLMKRILLYIYLNKTERLGLVNRAEYKKIKKNERKSNLNILLISTSIYVSSIAPLIVKYCFENQSAYHLFAIVNLMKCFCFYSWIQFKGVIKNIYILHNLNIEEVTRKKSKNQN